LTVRSSKAEALIRLALQSLGAQSSASFCLSEVEMVGQNCFNWSNVKWFVEGTHFGLCQIALQNAKLCPQSISLQDSGS
jgi:hypothetical protein